jgi:hypothetical protein
MVLPPEKLPRNPDQLIEIILDLRSEVETLRTSVKKLKAIIFGARSEKSAVIIAEQLPLGLGDVEAQAVLPAPANDDGQDDGGKTRNVGSRKKPKRNIGALPAHLPRFDMVIEPETTMCSCCAGALRRRLCNFCSVNFLEVFRLCRTIGRSRLHCEIDFSAHPLLVAFGE